jgi:hypothetical protein
VKGFILIVFLVLISQIRAELIDYPKYYSRSMLTKLEQADERTKKSVLSSHLIQSRVLSYKTARKYLFGKLEIKQDKNSYFIEDIYCQNIYTKSHGVKPMSIPNSSHLNCEHLWPQSRFNKSQSNQAQKTDLHHLAASNSRANSSRSNTEFADVINEKVVNPTCTASYRGDVLNYNRRGFEPPADRKGNIARSLFYFSTRYKLKISQSEEYYLRMWHESDPVDQEELERNQMVFEIQGNRNPFIDQPNLVSQISDF